MKQHSHNLSHIAAGSVIAILSAASTARAGDPAAQAYRTLYGAGEQALGFKVAGIGDFNNDGTPDYAITLLGGDTTHRGIVRVYSGADGAVLATIYGPSVFVSLFGSSIAGAGDIDHDGYGDVIIGSPLEINIDFGFNPPHVSMNSAVEVFSGATHQRLLRMQSDWTDDGTGWSVDSAGDVDGDGTPDIVAGAPFYGAGGRVVVYSGADGSILYTHALPQGGAELGFAVAGVGDINGDGHDDIMAGNPDGGEAFVLDAHNNATIFHLSTGSGFYGDSVASAGDLNGDGINELLVGAKNSARAYLYNGANGNLLRTFSGPSGSYFGYAVGSAGDFNHDGVGDIVVGASRYVRSGITYGRVCVYSGVTGSMIKAFEGPPGSANYFASAIGNAGDINGDGFDDLLVGASGYHLAGNTGGANGAAYLFLGVANQPGVYPPHSYSTGGSNPAFVTIADINHGGRPDVVTVDPVSRKLAIQYNNQNGSFGAPRLYSAGRGASSVVVSDLDNDGDLDLVTTATDENKLYYLRNNGHNGWLTADGTLNVGHQPRSIVAADFNQDGFNDIAIVNQLDNNVSVMLNNGNQLQRFPKRLGSKRGYAVGLAPIHMQVADLNGDQYPDLIVANSGSSSLSVLINRGDGRFFPQQVVATSDQPINLAVADFDHDGNLDVACVCSNDPAITIFHGDGSGVLSDPLSVDVPFVPTALIARDLTTDGWADLAVISSTDDSVSVLINDRSGGFGNPLRFNAQNNPVWIACADMDFDGDDDLVTVNRGPGMMTILSNQWFDP